MTEVQLFFSGLLGGVVDNLPIGYALGVGMMATVNPCGFTMLPVYLTLYMGAEADGFHRQPLPVRILRGLKIAGVVSAGFVVLFGAFGALIMAGARFLTEWMPWLATVMGVGLVVLGVWMLAGHRLSAGVFLRLSQRLGDPRQAGVRSFFLYGIAYALCSLSCTLPVFLVVVGGAITSGGFLFGVAQFLTYGLGMGLVILVLTVGIALLKEGLVVAKVRKLIPYMQHATAVLVILAGFYIVYYWLFKSGGLIWHT
jgi:cytochrome c biogenesis protein CcdA